MNETPNPDPRKRSITDLFNKTAHCYGTVGPNFFLHFGQALVDFAGITPSSRVLDVACGKGAVLFPAAIAAGAAGKVTGIDISSVMLEHAAQAPRNGGGAEVTLAPGDAENLEFDNASFDTVLCGFGVFFCTDPYRALCEAKRVLRPGGTLAISTWIRNEERRKWIAAGLSASLSATSLEEVMSRMPRGFDTPDDLRERLSKAGFGAIETRNETFAFFYKDEEEWWQAQWSHGVRSILEYIELKAGGDGLERFKAEAFGYLRSKRKPEGILQEMTAILTRAKN